MIIYLASPYTHPQPEVREDRYHTVCFACAKLMADGHFVYSPIAHTHGICIQAGGKNFKYEHWQKFDEEMIQLCGEFWILRMDGWDQSAGIKKELEYATSIGKPVRYV